MKVKKLLPAIKGGCSVDIPPAFFTEARNYQATWTTQRRQAENRRKGRREDQCTSPAAYDIDGKTYCRAHAANMALAHLEKATNGG